MEFKNNLLIRVFRLLAFAELVSLALCDGPFDHIRSLRSKVSVETQNAALQGLTERLFGERSVLFDVRVEPTSGTKDQFVIKASDSPPAQVTIVGTAAYATANGLNYYLKNFLHGQFTWSGQNIPIISNLPRPRSNITVELNDEVRYYENVCTSSYSFLWWAWPRWEREIDWMVLNGINLPLAFVGQETVAAQVFKKFGCNDTDLDAFFSGSPFLAWNRMGNLRGFGGPLSRRWMDDQRILQLMILKRMREFAMTPVVPGFNGFVPRHFETLFPKDNLTRASRWNNFPDEYSSPTFVEPSDALFSMIQESYVREYIALYGSDHLYNVDLFNELTPPNGDVDHLSSIAAGVYKAITSGDSQAVWVMQGWLFVNDAVFWNSERVKAFLTAVPNGKMIILDLFSEQEPQFSRLENYYGQPFIWCMLHNFGGVSGMFGNLDWVNKDVIEERKNASNMAGVGLTPEGTGQNEVMYEFMMENSYRTAAANVTGWILTFAKNRYGYMDEDLENAWLALHRSVYSLKDKATVNHGRYIITERPSLNMNPIIWYNETDVFSAMKGFIASSRKHPELCRNPQFEYDMVDVGRQSLQVKVAQIYKVLVDCYYKKDTGCLQNNTVTMLKTINLMDKVLATNTHFMLGSWLHDAQKAAGNSIEDKIDFVLDAKNQLTRWGPSGQILDYAAKMWSGLMRDYYGKRWEVFMLALEEAVRSGKQVDPKKVAEDIENQVEVPFARDIDTVYPHKPVGHVCQLRQKLLEAISQ